LDNTLNRCGRAVQTYIHYRWPNSWHFSWKLYK